MTNHLVTKYRYGELHWRDFYDLSTRAIKGITLSLHLSVPICIAPCSKADQSVSDHLHDAFSKSQGQDIIFQKRRKNSPFSHQILIE